MSKYMCNSCGEVYVDYHHAALCCPDVIDVSDDGRTLEEVREDYLNEYGDKPCDHPNKASYEWGICCWDCGWAEDWNDGSER